MPPAFVFPFGFTFQEGESIDFRTLLSREHWDEVRSASRYLRKEAVHGLDCLVIGVTRKSTLGDTENEVYLAVDKDYFPIRTISKADTGDSVFDVTTADVVVDGKRFVVPEKCESNAMLPSGELALRHVFEIDMSTLRINQPVDKSIFTIDRARARKGIIDEDDGGKLIPTPDSSVPVQHAKNGASAFVWTIGLNVLVLIVIVALVLLRMRR